MLDCEHRSKFFIYVIVLFNVGIVLFFFSGVLLISLALCADAVIGNVQEKVMKQTQASNAEVVCELICCAFSFLAQFFADNF